jgi:hypothetical protein
MRNHPPEGVSERAGIGVVATATLQGEYMATDTKIVALATGVTAIDIRPAVNFVTATDANEAAAAAATATKASTKIEAVTVSAHPMANSKVAAKEEISRAEEATEEAVRTRGMEAVAAKTIVAISAVVLALVVEVVTPGALAATMFERTASMLGNETGCAKIGSVLGGVIEGSSTESVPRNVVGGAKQGLWLGSWAVRKQCLCWGLRSTE